MRFRVERRERAGVEVVVLRDLAAQAVAEVVPALGDACVRFRVRVDGQPWPVLAEPPTDTALLHETTHYGVPILYPWPNRIRGGRFTFGGREYSLPPNSPGGHAIHGLVREMRWEVEAAATDESGAYVRSAVVVGGNGSDFPFESRLSVEHRLSGSALRIIVEAVNTGPQPMPMGFGLHPWFGVPLGAAGSRGACKLQLQGNGVWALDELIPTGRMVPPSGQLDLRAWRPLGEAFFDYVFANLELSEGWFEARLRDPASGRQIAVRSDEQFREHVVYAPRDRDVVCLEPYTCATDAFNLEARGIPAGMRVLEPGQHWRGEVEIVGARHAVP